jgi:hypothetical protein
MGIHPARDLAEQLTRDMEANRRARQQQIQAGVEPEIQEGTDTK